MRRKRRKRARGGLAGIADSISAPKSLDQKHVAIGILSAVAGNVIGAGLGKYSFWGGALVSGIGIASKNIYLASAGAGMIVNTVNRVPGATDGLDDVDGLSLNGVKDRMLHLMHNYKSRITLSGYEEEINGLGAASNVRYFHNPYETEKSSLDLSELNRIQEQVASMQGIGLSDVDPTERNF